MQFKVIQRVLGILLLLFSLIHLPPLAVSFICQDGSHRDFFEAMLITFGVGLLLWLPVRRYHADLKMRDGFVIVVMFWTVLGLFGMLPFYLSDFNISATDAVFESISGLTTTGATVLTGVDNLPASLSFYRQFLHWLGGMGIIVLAVAVLPMLGVGGMQLYRAETPGPVKDNKLTPRINETAKALWYVYLGLTVLCTLAFWLAGMSLFDAIGHAFSAISTGGFSTHDASIGYFNSALIEIICIFFMIMGSVNFALHFAAIRSASLKGYARNEELRVFLGISLFVGLVCAAVLFVSSGLRADDALRKGIFQAVSVMTTTGFATDTFYLWPAPLAVFLLLSSTIGGCAGATTGGLKVIRVLLLSKQSLREFKRLIHPNAHLVIKVGDMPLSEKSIESVWGFFSIYMAVFIASMLLLMVVGMDHVAAFSSVLATLNNAGPGLGAVGANFADASAPAKWILCLNMLMGRLEIFTFLVLFTPVFWRR